ncbi:MAG TPA: amino acid permease [Blastocatellia bacterium]|nr:amino acid permease [Blastocatellia bacterium]
MTDPIPSSRTNPAGNPIRSETILQSGRRVLTLPHGAAIVVSSMVGTGIFTTTGLMIAMGASGGDILLAWLIGGIVALCGALCYAEIGANLPHSGGEYFFLSRLLHPSLGVASGWASLVVGFAAPIAASALAMHLYVASVIPGWPARSMAVLTILLLSTLHSFGVRLGGRVQTSLIVIQLLLLLAFVVGILLRSDHSIASFTGINPSFWSSSAFAVVLIFVSFAYSGWNAAAYVGGEIRDPERVLPRSLMLGTATVAVLYLLVNVAYLSAAPLARLSGVKDVANVAAQSLWGPAAGGLVSMLIAITLISPVSAMIMIGPRVLEAMSVDGFMPASFGRLNRHKVPATAIFAQASIAGVLAATSSFGPLLVYIGFTLNIFAALTVLSLFRLRRQGSAHRLCAGYPITPLIFVAFAAWTTVWSIRAQPLAAVAGLLTLLIGWGAYLFKTGATERGDPGEHQTARVYISRKWGSAGMWPEIFTDKIGESGRALVRRAYEEARSRYDKELRTQHVLIAFAESESTLFDELLKKLKLDRGAVLQTSSEKPRHDAPQYAGMKVSREFHELLSEGLKHAREQGRPKIESIDILFGFFADERGSIATLFRQLGAEREAVLRHIADLNPDQ